MIKIFIKDEALDLPDTFALDVEDSSPIFNDRGSQSIPATVPPTPRNRRLLGFPDKIYTLDDPATGFPVVVVCGAETRAGVLNITESGPEGISFNIGFDNSIAYMKWAGRKLADIELPSYEYGYPEELVKRMWNIYRTANPKTSDYAVFPVLLATEEADGTTYHTVANMADASGFYQPDTIEAPLDGKETAVTVPTGYGITPFLRVWRLLELLFADIGLTLDSNPFKDDKELARLVVLNNTMDAICTGRLYYSDLVPDCTVEEFLNALWVRFGLVYNIDWSRNTVDLRLLKNILRQRPGLTLDTLATGRPKIMYEAARYIKLSAGTSLEGAAPAAERFEDFARGADLEHVCVGDNVADWAYDNEAERWDGNVRDDYFDDEELPEPPDPDEPEPPDPDDDPLADGWIDYPEDRDDYGDYDFYDTGTRSAQAPARAADASMATGVFLASEFGSCKWYRLDKTNSRTKKASTPFFNWDPQPDGLDALELTAADECVPVGPLYFDWYTGTTRHLFSSLLPHYLTGSRFRHTYIKGSDSTDAEETSTPLAFMLAYTLETDPVKGAATIGRFHPLDTSGRAYALADGSTPTLSLLFQFSDGLFATYWKEYDEILRHGKRAAEVTIAARRPLQSLLTFMQPVVLGAVPCMLDKAQYTQTRRPVTLADLTVRPLYTQGHYDIEAERPVPSFLPAWHNLAWRLRRDDLAEMADKAREQAAREYIAANHWREHDGFKLNAGTVYVRTLDRITRWTDIGFARPTREGERLAGLCRARVSYEVYEENAAGVEIALGEISIVINYHVEVVARLFKE